MVGRLARYIHPDSATRSEVADCAGSDLEFDDLLDLAVLRLHCPGRTMSKPSKRSQAICGRTSSSWPVHPKHSPSHGSTQFWEQVFCLICNCARWPPPNLGDATRDNPTASRRAAGLAHAGNDTTHWSATMKKYLPIAAAILIASAGPSFAFGFSPGTSSGFGRGEITTTSRGPIVTTGRIGQMETTTLPGSAGQGLLMDNGNGTSTLIIPGGAPQTVVTPR
jgi:hypothetical protein